MATARLTALLAVMLVLAAFRAGLVARQPAAPLGTSIRESGHVQRITVPGHESWEE